MKYMSTVYKVGKVFIIITDFIFVASFVFSLFNLSPSTLFMCFLLPFALAVSVFLLLLFKNTVTEYRFEDNKVYFKKADGTEHLKATDDCVRIKHIGGWIKLQFKDNSKFIIMIRINFKGELNVNPADFGKENFANAEIKKLFEM